MVIFMAGLNDIPPDFYEAAQLDGANRRQMFWHVTIPLLRNPLIFVTVSNSLFAWQVFTPVLQAWAADEVPLTTYPAGSSGP